MAQTDEFNFEAPQFIESLTEAQEAEDGADNFFDAVENVAEKSTVASTAEKSSPEILCAEESNDENLAPSSTKKGCGSRVSSQSVKNIAGPLRRSARFTSLAEELHRFHHATPPRFKRKSGDFKSRNKFLPTVGRSPLLQTKFRARQSTACPMKIEERSVVRNIKKPQLQAKPPPKPAPKPITVPQPFKLTDPNKFKKVTKLDDELKSPASKCKSPNVKKSTLEIENGVLVEKQVWAIRGLKTVERPNSVTKVVPFSFEQRDQERLKAKQKKQEEDTAKSDTFKVPLAPKAANKSRASTAPADTDMKKQRLTRASLSSAKH